MICHHLCFCSLQVNIATCILSMVIVCCYGKGIVHICTMLMHCTNMDYTVNMDYSMDYSSESVTHVDV